MKRLTTLAIGLALAGAFAASAQAAPQYENDSRYSDRPHEESNYSYRHHDRFSDEAIDRRVTRALNRELGNDADDINVSVRNGNVFLSGYVDHWNDRRQAREVAANVWGVRDVYARRLRVKYR